MRQLLKPVRQVLSCATRTSGGRVAYETARLRLARYRIEGEQARSRAAARATQSAPKRSMCGASGCGRMARAIAHDVNNVLNAIGLWSGLWSRGNPSPAELATASARVGEAVKLGQRLTQQLLSFGRKRARTFRAAWPIRGRRAERGRRRERREGPTSMRSVPCHITC